MAYLNKCMIIGNLGKDPTIGYNTSGRAKCSLSVAVTERYKDSNGEQKERCVLGRNGRNHQAP